MPLPPTARLALFVTLLLPSGLLEAQDEIRTVSHGGNSSSSYRPEATIEASPKWPARKVELKEADHWHMPSLVFPSTHDSARQGSAPAAEIQCRRDDLRSPGTVKCWSQGEIAPQTLKQIRRALRQTDPYGHMAALRLARIVRVEWRKLRKRAELLCKPGSSPRSRTNPCRKIQEKSVEVQTFTLPPHAGGPTKAPASPSATVTIEGQTLPPLLMPVDESGASTTFFRELFPAGLRDTPLGHRPYFVVRNLRRAIEGDLPRNLADLLRYNLAAAELAIGNFKAAEDALPGLRAIEDKRYAQHLSKLIPLIEAVRANRRNAGARTFAGETP